MISKKSSKRRSLANIEMQLDGKNLPASQGMLYLVRSEIKADNRVLRSEMKAGFNRVDAQFSNIDAQFSNIEAQFSNIDAQFSNIEAQFSNVDSRFNQVSAKIENILSEVSRIGVLVEEQNSRNQIVLEGVVTSIQRQEGFHSRLSELENSMRVLARTEK